MLNTLRLSLSRLAPIVPALLLACSSPDAGPSAAGTDGGAAFPGSDGGGGSSADGSATSTGSAGCTAYEDLTALLARGITTTFTAEYANVCETTSCKAAPATATKYKREYYAPGKGRIDQFADASYTVTVQSTTADIRQADGKQLLCKADVDSANMHMWKCTPNTIMFFSDLAIGAPTFTGATGKCPFDKAVETAPQTIAGESARCFDVSNAATLAATYCLTTDGILVVKTNHIALSESGITVTKLTRSADPSVFDSLDGKSY